MRVRDPDELLIQELLRPPPLEQARASHEFWRRRRAGLAMYRVTARREAKRMIRITREQVAAAERARYGTGLVGLARRLLAGEPFPWRFGRTRFVARLAWRVGPRRMIDAVAACVLVVAAVVLALQVI